MANIGYSSILHIRYDIGKRQIKAGVALLFAALSWGLSAPAEAATYYVDFQNGNDSNNGLSQATPWKRAPGDPAATGNANRALVAGDTVLFKGGVVYRGNIVLSRSGSSGSPITYKGDGWGTPKASIQGDEMYQPVWTRCPSASACGNNTNYAQIFYAAPPGGYSNFQTAIYENGELLWFSQSPNPRDPFYYDEIGDFFTVPFPNTTVVQNQSSITDPRNLTQTSATFWNGASVVGWITGNVVEIKSVTSFDPATDTLFHQSFSNAPYKDREGRYALMNHISLVDRAGEYALDAANGRFYLWPKNGADPNSNQYGVYARDAAFFSNAAVNYVTVEGIDIQHFTYGFQMDSTAASNVIIRNNDVRNLRSGGRYAIFLNARDSLIEGNRVVDANRAVGILSSATNITIRNNHVERTSRQGIWFMGASNSRILNNTVIDIAGSHSNGISIYSGSQDIVVSGNKLINVNSPITYEASTNITFSNNIVASGQISDWFGMQGTVAFYNNTFPNSNFSISSSPSYIFKNNILNRTPPGSRSHNIYTRSGLPLQTGESIETDLSRLFVNAGTNDFHLKSGSPAINSGTSVPVTVDLDGTSRPQAVSWDVGAYEFGGPPPPPANPHPADTNTDFLMGLNEATKYGACWKNPAAYGDCPTGIAIDYAVRAGTLWSGSATGQYQYNSTSACPMCWEVKP